MRAPRTADRKVTVVFFAYVASAVMEALDIPARASGCGDLPETVSPWMARLQYGDRIDQYENRETNIPGIPPSVSVPVPGLKLADPETPPITNRFPLAVATCIA